MRRWCLVLIGLCCAPSIGWSDAIERVVLTEGMVKVIPEGPLEKVYAEDPEVIAVTLSALGEGTVVALKPGLTWVFYWHAGRFVQWEVEVQEDTFKVLRRREDLERVRRARWGLQNFYQFESNSQFSEQQLPHGFLYGHTLNSYFPFKESGVAIRQNARWVHSSNERPALQSVDAGLQTRHWDLSLGDAGIGGGTDIPFQASASARGATLTFKDFFASPNPDQSVDFSLAGGIESKGTEALLPNFSTGSKVFGATWNQRTGKQSGFSVQTVTFQPTGHAHYLLTFSEGAHGKLGPFGWREGFTWSGRGVATRAGAGVGWKRIGLGADYGYAGRGLVGMQGNEQTNDSHFYGVGLSEDLLPEKLQMRQGFGHSFIVPNATVSLRSRTYSGHNGLTWIMSTQDTASVSYAVQDTFAEGPQVAIAQQSHSGALFYAHQFPNKLPEAPSTQAVSMNASYQTSRGADLTESFALGASYTSAAEQKFWNAAVGYSHGLRPRKDRLASANVSWNLRRSRWSVQTRHGLQLSLPATGATSLSWSPGISANWDFHPRHHLQAIINFSMALSPWGSGPHLNGGLGLSYFSRFGRGVAAEPLLKSIFRGGGGKGPKDVVGRVFHDTNYNEQWDASERGLAGITVEIPGMKPVTTDASGQFQFKDLAAGTYDVRINVSQLPPGILLRTPSPTYAAVSPHGPRRTTVLFAAAEERANVMAAVFEDTNGNGDFDLADGGIVDVPLRFRSAGRVDPCKTNRTGYCRYFPPSMGDVTVTVDTTDLPPDVTLSRTTGSVAVSESREYRLLFIATVLRAVGGQIFLDKDGNRVWSDGDRPLPNAVIMIGPHRVVADAEGKFTVRDIRPGTYPVRLLQGIPKGGRLPGRLKQIVIDATGGALSLTLPIRQ